MRKKKVYCMNCTHHSWVGEDYCARAATITVRGTETYYHPDLRRKQYCWEKNGKNKCPDYEDKLTKVT